MTRHLISFALLLLVATGAAACHPTPTVPKGGTTTGDVNLVDDLRAAGATIEPAGEVSQPFFSVKGKVIKVNGGDVQVFEYPSAAAAAAAAADVASDGSTVGKSHVGWIAPPHFYKKGKTIALYVGDSTTVTKVLKAVLGPQFAGK